MNLKQTECLNTIEAVHRDFPEAGEYLLDLFEKRMSGEITNEKMEGGFTFSESVNSMLLWREHSLPASVRYSWGEVCHSLLGERGY